MSFISTKGDAIFAKLQIMQGGNTIIAKTNNQARELMPLMGYCGQRPQFG
jgi:hypothetical protein